MDPLIDLHEQPTADEIYMIAGWRHWADAGSVSSELPQYLIDQTGARQIGRLRSDGFYLFQIPGTHHFLRPEITLVDGYRQELRYPRNEVFYTGDDQRGLVLFLGDEPHMNAERYAEAFFELVKTLGVRRVVGLGGVYGAVPFERERNISCAYSLPAMKDELARYAVRFSNYQGGVSLGSYLTDQAEKAGVEYFSMYAFVPMYDLSQLSQRLQTVSVEEDYKAWLDVMRRLNAMLSLGIDLTDLEHKSDQLIAEMNIKLDELESKTPKHRIRDHIEKMTEDFVELPFNPLDDLWSKELGDIFKDLDV
ncbi:MAG: PAC2 family protein [Anaerolineae bacterium]|nr:PAC2 family protein [Anaerolineae bacterium]